MFKKIAIGIGVLVVLIAVGLYVLLSNLDGLIKTALERYGSEATQAEVTVGAVDLSATSGTGSISQLTIGNPKGFSAPTAFSLGEVKIGADVSTLTNDTVLIKEIIIDAPQVTYEMGPSGSNLETLQKNVSAYAAKMGGGASSSAPSAPSSSAPAGAGAEKKLIIESLVVRDGRVSASHAAVPGQSVNSDLPTIQLRDIGKAKGGATPAEVANEIIGAISREAAKAATADVNKLLQSLDGGALGDAAKGGAGGAAEQLRGILGR